MGNRGSPSLQQRLPFGSALLLFLARPALGTLLERVTPSGNGDDFGVMEQSVEESTGSRPATAKAELQNAGCLCCVILRLVVKAMRILLVFLTCFS